jgi:hypothetical protein
MTSTRPLIGLTALLTGIALALGAAASARGQPPKKRKVELMVRGDNDHCWLVDQGGTGFVAKRNTLSRQRQDITRG